MFTAYFVTFTRLYGGVVYIDVIQLYLYEFDFGILGKNSVEHFRFIVERKPEVSYFTFFFEFDTLFVRATAFEFFVSFGCLLVHKIKVEIIYAEYVQLAFKKRTDFAFAVEIRARKFVGENVFIPRVAFYETLRKSGLAFTVEIAVRGIEIIKTTCDKQIDHFRKFVEVDFVAVHRQTHATETEILFYFVKSVHIVLLIYNSFR